MYGTTWEKRLEKGKALKLLQKSVRGTISNRLKPAIANDPLKLNAEIEKPNPQTVDACALGGEEDTLKLAFSLKVLGGVDTPSACNNTAFKTSYQTVVRSYIETEKFTELAKRYALNIVNARALWRNRLGAEKVEVRVSLDEQKTWTTFNAFDFPLSQFEKTTPDVLVLAEKIRAALTGESPLCLIHVQMCAKVGKAQEVYPSEELVLDKGRGDKSKILYAVEGVAAMHSQKIGNAIRTIDTWYPDYADTEKGVGPIAIEVYGSVTNLGEAFRRPKDKVDFYTLFDQFALGNPLPRKEDEHYVMAVLVRGGVFGKSDKKEDS